MGIVIDRQLIHLLSALCMVLLVCCKPSGTESTQPQNKESELGAPVDFDLAKIQERDTLRVIVDNSSTSYFLYKGQPMGFEYELLSRLGIELGVHLDIIITKSIGQAFRKLNNGEGDIIAYSLTVTKERKKKVAFTDAHYTVRQVLVQRKPENWREMKLHEIERELIRNQVELIGKQVHVRSSSSYLDRLIHLSEEIGGDIIIIEESEEADTETLIKRVAHGEIEYTIADENVALVNAAYYPILDVKTPVSFPQRIAWAVRKNAPALLQSINSWIAEMKKGPLYNITYNKYFRNPKSVRLVRSDYSSITGGRISEYDDLIKQWADSLNWDWLLLAALIYQESKFDPNAKSWAGAHGLMQLIPATARRFGASNIYDPVQNISSGARYILHLDELWQDIITNKEERLKFVLASYNVGPGHVLDARRLAKKYGKDPNVWDNNVSFYLIQKSKPKYYNDPVVKQGYCRGEEPVNYVHKILSRYQRYLEIFKEQNLS